MPHFFDLPARSGLPSTKLYTRISTPHSHDAERVDSRYPTVLFIHPLWTDSFFFYPQYEDPVFAELFNLVAFDYRGHGLTTGELPDGSTYSWREVADDCNAILGVMGVQKAHIVAVGSSVPAAITLALKYPSLALSISLAAPAPRTETPVLSSVFDELLHSLETVVTDMDEDGLEHIVVSMFDFHLDYQHATQLRGVKADYVSMARQALLSGQMRSAAPFIQSLLRMRRDVPSDDELASLRCPILVLNETQEGDSVEQDQSHLVSIINYDKPLAHPLAVEHHIEGPKWLTLASPNLVNPVLSAFLSTPRDVPLTPPASSSLSSPRPVSRRPSTPRDVSTFSIPPLPPLQKGVMTVGEALDQEARRRAEQDNMSGVNMTVEVVVTVDEAA